MKSWNVIGGVVSSLFVASILTFSLSTEIASAHGQDCKGPHKNDMGCNGGGGGGGDGTIPVMVTFQDGPSDHVMSDGKGPYIDGVDKVSTAVGHDGSFYLKRSKGNQEAIRKLILDFSQCDSDCSTAPPCSPACTALRGKVGGGGINLSAMDVKSTGDIALFINMHLGAENGGFFTLYFDTSRSNCAGYDAQVTRTFADTWEIVGQTACLEELNGSVFRGNYNMPFMMTVQAL